MCRPVCCVLHGVWGFCYIAGGSVQLVAGIFFLLSLPVFKIGSNIWTGACNVLIGVITFMLCCFGDITKSRTQGLFYLAFIALGLNIINLVVLEAGEWHLLMTKQIRQTIERKNLHDLAYYARLSTSVTTGIVILIALVDIQITFCTLQYMKKSFLVHKNVNETVSDIEYIIPRNKSCSVNSNKAQSVNNFTQSWVFDAETGACSLNESPALTLYPSAPVGPEPGCPPCQGHHHYSSTPVVKGHECERGFGNRIRDMIPRWARRMNENIAQWYNGAREKIFGPSYKIEVY